MWGNNMSIKSNKIEYEIALQQAYLDFPRLEKYEDKPDKCKHNLNFVIYCKGDWDIVRCNKCGYETVIPCSFDEEYN